MSPTRATAAAGLSAVRAWASSCLAAAFGFGVVSAGCGTDALGVDDCRKIEKARCSAGQHCGFVDDVEACRRFYRDQCLHGLAVEPPPNAAVARCVSTIEAAGDCAASGDNPPLTECPGVIAPSLARICDVVLNPEKTEACAFLSPSPEPGGSSSTGGSGGSAGGFGAGAGAGGLP